MQIARYDRHGGRALDEKMNAVVASAAALVATVCAEAAESMGADRERAASGISTGLATKTSADMVTLIATAATCNAPFATSFTVDSRRSLV
ncbi:hypothetical protein BHE74_00037466 [Ensete ventricosum]|nr:hypothetical protein BHE74_00037466 [Ensete ventricosum]